MCWGQHSRDPGQNRPGRSTDLRSSVCPWKLAYPEIAKSVAGEYEVLKYHVFLGYRISISHAQLLFLGPGVAFDFHFHCISFLRFSLSGNRVPQDPMVCHHFPYEIAILGNMIYQIFGRTQLDTMVNARCGVALWWCERTCSTEPMNSLSSRKGRHRNLSSAGFCPETGDLAPNLVVISVGKVMINHDKPW